MLCPEPYSCAPCMEAKHNIPDTFLLKNYYTSPITMHIFPWKNKAFQEPTSFLNNRVEQNGMPSIFPGSSPPFPPPLPLRSCPSPMYVAGQLVPPLPVPPLSRSATCRPCPAMPGSRQHGCAASEDSMQKKAKRLQPQQRHKALNLMLSEMNAVLFCSVLGPWHFGGRKERKPYRKAVVPHLLQGFLHN